MPDPSPWISVGQLSEAFHSDSYVAEPTSDLVGRTLTLSLEDGRSISLMFDSPGLLRWTVPESLVGETLPAHARPASALPGAGGPTNQSYRAVRVREALYFVDFVWSEMRATSVSLVLDLSQRAATILIGTLPDAAEARRPLSERISSGDELTGVSAIFLSAAIGTSFAQTSARHLPSTDLVGRRVEYTYGANERYEHIYLNPSFYTWHCLAGSEKGLADTDRCHHLKVAEDLYLFVWREKIVPTLGVVMVDFAAMRTAGKILGYSGDIGSTLANFPVGAHARVLNITRYDEPAR